MVRIVKSLFDCILYANGMKSVTRIISGYGIGSRDLESEDDMGS